MKEVRIINLDRRILKKRDFEKKRVIYMNQNFEKKRVIYMNQNELLDILNYFMDENKASIEDLGLVYNDNWIGVIIPKEGTKINNKFYYLEKLIVLTFLKKGRKNRNILIYETRTFQNIEEIIKHTIKEGEFIKPETMPEEFCKCIY